MASPADDRSAKDAARARLLDELRGRLETAEALAHGVREALVAGDAPAIDAAAARAETLAQEFKVLSEEYGRLGSDPGDPGEALVRARARFEETTMRLARSSALTGGLLERMLALSRGLAGLLGLGQKGTYESSGRPAEFAARGTRFGEWV